MVLVTSSWSTGLPARIGISRGGPREQRWFKTYRALAPGPWLKPVNDEEFLRLHMNQLAALDPARVSVWLNGAAWR